MFPHNTTPTKNSHMLIRAPPAKSGGHRAHARIAPDAVAGYIAALRETNTPTDGAVPTISKKVWKPKPPKGRHGPSDGHSDERIDAALNPAVGLVPSDFANIGSTGMEEELGLLVTGTDDWTYVKENPRDIPGRYRAVLSDRRAALGNWRGRYLPILQVDIEPWAIFYMDQSREDFLWNS